MKKANKYALVGVITLIGAVLWLVVPRLLEKKPEGLIFASGRVEGDEVVISTRVSGQILELKVDEGDQVQKGDLLARISSDQIMARLNSVKAEAERAEQQKHQAHVDLGFTDRRTAAQVEEARAALGAAKAKLANVKFTYARVSGDYKRYKALYAGLYGLPKKTRSGRIQEMMKALRLSGLERRLASALPLGIRQRLSLACALLHEPLVLFLDEPTSGVDPVARRTFWEIIYGLSRDMGVTILVSTHYMDEAEHCDRLGLMHQGKLIAADAPSSLKQAAERGSGGLLVVRTSHFRRAFDVIHSCFPGAMLHGSRIHLQTLNPDSDETVIRRVLEENGISGATVKPQGLSMEETFANYIQAAERNNV